MTPGTYYTNLSGVAGVEPGGGVSRMLGIGKGDRGGRNGCSRGILFVPGIVLAVCLVPAPGWCFDIRDLQRQMEENARQFQRELQRNLQGLQRNVEEVSRSFERQHRRVIRQLRDQVERVGRQHVSGFQRSVNRLVEDVQRNLPRQQEVIRRHMENLRANWERKVLPQLSGVVGQQARRVWETRVVPQLQTAAASLTSLASRPGDVAKIQSDIVNMMGSLQRFMRERAEASPLVHQLQQGVGEALSFLSSDVGYCARAIALGADPERFGRFMEKMEGIVTQLAEAGETARLGEVIRSVSTQAARELSVAAFPSLGRGAGDEERPLGDRVRWLLEKHGERAAEAIQELYALAEGDEERFVTRLCTGVVPRMAAGKQLDEKQERCLKAMFLAYRVVTRLPKAKRRLLYSMLQAAGENVRVVDADGREKKLIEVWREGVTQSAPFLKGSVLEEDPTGLLVYGVVSPDPAWLFTNCRMIRTEDGRYATPVEMLASSTDVEQVVSTVRLMKDLEGVTSGDPEAVLDLAVELEQAGSRHGIDR